MLNRMKNTLIMFLLLPFFSSAQKFYLQGGAGYIFPDYPGNSGGGSRSERRFEYRLLFPNRHRRILYKGQTLGGVMHIFPYTQT